MVKVIVGPSSQIFYAHEGILTKVDYFDRTLSGGFMESKTREVTLPDDDPQIFSSVLEFLYSEEYSARFKMAGGTKGVKGVKSIPGYNGVGLSRHLRAAAMRHAKIYCLADKFGMAKLQKLVLEKLRFCGPLRNTNFLEVASYLVANSSDYQGEVSAFLEPYIAGIPYPA